MAFNWKRTAIIVADCLIGIYLVLAITAFNHPDELSTVCTEVRIDIKDGLVAIKGWTEKTAVSGTEMMRRMADDGVGVVIVTDISKDGAMKGVNRALYRRISGIGPDVTASGGVSTIDDIIALKKTGIHGAIIGKAYYTGAIDLREAVEAAE